MNWPYTYFTAYLLYSSVNTC